MMEKPLTIVIEIGSTITKATAFLIQNESLTYLGRGYSLTTVNQGDVTIGLEKALNDLKTKLKLNNVSNYNIYGNSSAAGGLKMTVHGLVPEMTAKAAKEAALGAGAVVKLVTSGKINDEDIKRIEKISPKLILLAGGVDWGEETIILDNAKALSSLTNKPPIIYAGNIAIKDEVNRILTDRGFQVYLTQNVYPRLDELNIDPVKKIIQEAFEKHITEGPGMGKVKEWIKGHLMPTPGAVMNAISLLYEELGDILGFDVGGATTDVHSITEGDEELRLITPYPEPKAKRTVEGDLGVYVSATHVLNLLNNDERKNIEEYIPFLSPIPLQEKEIELSKILAQKAVETALLRHVGELKHTFSPTGRGSYVWGRDLTKIKWVVGTGGTFSFLPGMKEVLEKLFSNRPASRLLLPREPQILIDENYLLSSIGTLAYQDSAFNKKILLNFLLESFKLNKL